VVAAGAGCTGDLEETQSATGLCVARWPRKLVPVEQQTTASTRRRVTRGQYEAWVATNPFCQPARMQLRLEVDGKLRYRFEMRVVVWLQKRM